MSVPCHIYPLSVTIYTRFVCSLAAAAARAALGDNDNRRALHGPARATAGRCSERALFMQEGGGRGSLEGAAVIGGEADQKSARTRARAVDRGTVKDGRERAEQHTAVRCEEKEAAQPWCAAEQG